MNVHTAWSVEGSCVEPLRDVSGRLSSFKCWSAEVPKSVRASTSNIGLLYTIDTIDIQMTFVEVGQLGSRT